MTAYKLRSTDLLTVRADLDPNKALKACLLGDRRVLRTIERRNSWQRLAGRIDLLPGHGGKEQAAKKQDSNKVSHGPL